MAQTKLLNTYWKQNSPFGTFLLGDSIDTYWDTDTDWFYTTLNGVVTTSGTDIPPAFTYAGENQDYYLTRTFYQASICNSTTLYTFQLYPLFPYLFRTQFANHPTCELVSPGITPTTCDLNFDTLAVVTDVSADSAFDGQMVVSASGSNGAVQYRLNADFAYGDGTAQTSGTFTGLGKGNYLVYTRDENNCLARLSVTIGIQKSYGVKYRLEYYDEITKLFHHKTEILQKDYSGDVTEVCGSNNPTVFALRGEGEQDKFVPILPSEITFSMLSETDGVYQDLYTNDPEKYRIRHSIDDVVIWIGKMLPNQYEEAFVSSPYIVNAVAIDGLASLKDFYFLDEENNRLAGQLKVISVIAWILRKIGLGINIRSGCNIYATGMATTAADDPLDQSYVDVSRYYLITDTPTCWDVLRYILEPFTAQIILYHNVWNITRVEERIAAFDYREYDSNGDYVSNSTYSPVKNLSNSVNNTRMVWRDQSQLLKINPGYGQLRLIYNLGLKDSILINGDFAINNFAVQANVGSGTLVQGTIPDMSGFLLVNNATVITTGIDYLGDNNVAVQLTTDEIGGYLQSEVIDLKLGNSEGLKITFKYMAFNRLPDAADITTYDPLLHYIKVKIKVRYGDYYLTRNGTWTTVDSNIKFYVTPDLVLKYQTFEVKTSTPLDTYINGEEFQVFVYTANAMDYDYGSFVNLRAVPTYTTGQVIGTGERTEAYDSSVPNWIHYYELLENTNAESSPDIIRPDDYDATNNPRQWVKVNGAIIADYDTTLSIDKIMVEVLSNTKSLPEAVTASRSMENENNLNLNKIIYHGSLIDNSSSVYRAGIFPEGFFDGTIPGLFDDMLYHIDEWWLRSLVSGWAYTANSADVAYSGYFRDTNGVGYTLWARDAVPGSLSLETIFQDVLTAQYNKPWRSIHGPFTGDILFSPIDVINEQTDPLGERIYFPPFLEIDYRHNSYNAQFLELTDVTNSEGETGAAFTIGFSLGYKS